MEARRIGKTSPRRSVTVLARAMFLLVLGSGGFYRTSDLPDYAICNRADIQQIYSAAESSPVHGTKDRTPPSTSVPGTIISTPVAGVQPPLPPLTADVISETKGPSPTDAALEKSVSVTTSSDDKLKAALAEIEQLKSQLAEAQGPQVTGLRKRGGGQGGMETAVEKAKEVVHSSGSGVPVEVVGGIVVAVFVLTYLFF